MLKRTIEYTDLDGDTRKEDHYFNFTKTEIMEMQLSVAGGMDQRLKKIVEAHDTKEIFGIVKTVVLDSYGEKDPNGKRFIKSAELSLAFEQSPAYDVLMQELTSDANLLAAFVNAVIPQQPNPVPPPSPN